MRDADGVEYKAAVPKTLYRCFGREHPGHSGDTMVGNDGACIMCGSQNIGKYTRVALVVDATEGKTIHHPDVGN